MRRACVSVCVCVCVCVCVVGGQCKRSPCANEKGEKERKSIEINLRL
jgi:hypothetical protein